MIKWYYDNRVTGKPTWFYRTLVYDASIIEHMLYNIVFYRKVHSKSTYIAICGYDGIAVAGVKVTTDDLYTVSGRGFISNFVMYNAFYKIEFSSFDTVCIIPVK